MSELVTRSYLMDFTLQSMELHIGNVDEDEEVYEGELDELWKNRGDRRAASDVYERRADGDALDEDNWEGSDIQFAEGSIQGDVEGEFVDADGGDFEMEDVDGFIGGSDGSGSEEEDERPHVRMANGHLANGHLPNGHAGVSDSSDSEEDESDDDDEDSD
jgi:hypothetical protein